MHLSFVLLSRPCDLDGQSVLASFGRLFPGVPAPLATPPEGALVELRSADGVTTLIALMHAAVPDHEAAMAADRSVAALAGPGAADTKHAAHLTVASSGGTGLPALVAHTRVVAACADACGAVAVYEGTASATHPAAFYIDVAMAVNPPLTLWTGLSVAHVASQRTEILTLGIEQMLGLPDMLVSAPRGAADEAVAFLFDLLLYAVQEGPLPDGDTVGRSAQERLCVRYVESPVDSSKLVARVELA